MKRQLDFSPELQKIRFNVLSFCTALINWAFVFKSQLVFEDLANVVRKALTNNSPHTICAFLVRLVAVRLSNHSGLSMSVNLTFLVLLQLFCWQTTNWRTDISQADWLVGLFVSFGLLLQSPQPPRQLMAIIGLTNSKLLYYSLIMRLLKFKWGLF